MICSFSVYSQKLELINVDNIKKLPLGQGLQLELRLNIDEVQVESKSKYELVSESYLQSKFMIIPKDTGQYKIGPIISGNLVSNSLIINVIPLTIDSSLYITMPDSASLGDELKLTVTNISKSGSYTIKDLKMKPSPEYNILGESFSMTVSQKGDEMFKKETLTVTIKPLVAGEISIDENSFNAQGIKGFLLKRHTLIVVANSK